MTPGIDEDVTLPIMTPANLKIGTVEGTTRIVHPQDSTPTTLVGAGACSNPTTVAGTIWFGTPMGPVSVAIALGLTPAQVVALINAATRGLIWASQAGGIITITTYDRGPLSDVYYIQDSTSGTLNTDLGDFTLGGGATLTQGTAPSYVEMYCPDADVLAIGNAASSQLLYNTSTGKLTIPGVIDPIAMLYQEVDETGPTFPAVPAGYGAVFVASGAGALTQNKLYYKNSSGSYEDLSAGAAASQTPVIINLTSDQTTTQGGGQIQTGQFQFGALDFTGAYSTFEFFCTIQITNVATTGRVRLYNLTNTEYVTGADLTTSATAWGAQSAAMTVGVGAGELRAADTIYEIHIEVTGGAGGDVVNAGNVWMRISP